MIREKHSHSHIYINIYIYNISNAVDVSIFRLSERDKRRQAEMNGPYPCRVDGNTAIKRGLCP